MKILTKSYSLLVIVLIIFGVFLRLLNYASLPPFGETRDEFMYPWAGMTLIQNGIPSSWSYFDSYKNRKSITLWDQEFRIVTPWFDKPLLYPLITGGFLYVLGARDFADVSLSSLRIIPLILSILTMFFLTLVAKQLFSKSIAILSLILYATIPTIVLSNRLSLTENLLTPLILLIIYLAHKLNFKTFTACFIIGALAGLTFHTKQIGAVIVVYPLYLLISKKLIKSAVTILSVFFAFFFIQILIVSWYDLGLYLRVMSDFRHAHTLVGLPELIQTIFRFPTLSQKTRLFLDGSVLLGLLTLFILPITTLANRGKLLALSLFPFSYLCVLTLVESGATNFSYFGWHIYPLFPFISIVLALYFYKIYTSRDLFLLVIPLFILGSSAIRFVFLTLPQSTHYLWQYIFISLLSSFIFLWQLKSKRQYLLITIFVAFVVVNVYAVISSPIFYPSTPAHLDQWGPLFK